MMVFMVIAIGVQNKMTPKKGGETLMNTEKKKRNAGSKIAIIVIIVYLLLPLVMTLIYSLFQEWIDVMPTGFTLGAYTELFTDPLFWKAVGRTVIISIVSDYTVYSVCAAGDVCRSCLPSGLG